MPPAKSGMKVGWVFIYHNTRRRDGDIKNVMAKYFKKEEFACKCGCGRAAISSRLLLRLDKARELFGGAIHINSGYRCENHNKAIGGKQDSAHLAGGAADLSCVNSRDRYHLLCALLASGFNRVGITPTFFHVDIDESKSPNVIWLYKE